jgi:hypothetical protein
MKKFTLILSALMVLMCGFMFMGCDEEIEEFLAPSGVWCQTTMNYTSEDSSSALYVYYYWNDTTKTFSGTTNYTAPSGLTVVVTPYSSNEVAGLAKGQYTIKTWANGETFSFDTDDTAASSEVSDAQTQSAISKLGTMNRTKWGLVYTAAKSKAKDAEGFKKLTGAPECLTAAGATNKELTWENVKSNFSWKKIVAGYLLQ